MRQAGNMDGWHNKLVTIFARHRDSSIMMINFSLISQIRDWSFGQILQPRQLYLSPGLAKMEPYLLCHMDSFSAKVLGLNAGWLHQVTLTAHTRWLLGIICT
jgi:hypothetical protein